MRGREEIWNDACSTSRDLAKNPLMMVLEVLLDIREIAHEDHQLRRHFIGVDEDEEELKRIATERIPKGKRHDALTEIALGIRRKLEEPGTVLQQMLIYNAQFCDPPLPDDEVEQIVRQVYTVRAEGPYEKGNEGERSDYSTTRRRSGD